MLHGTSLPSRLRARPILLCAFLRMRAETGWPSASWMSRFCLPKLAGEVMDTSLLKRESDFEWHIPKTRKMRVPGIIYASEELVRDMDDKVHEQMTNVATLPGIQKASFAMPDAHWGYGFPIGGV